MKNTQFLLFIPFWIAVPFICVLLDPTLAIITQILILGLLIYIFRKASKLLLVICMLFGVAVFSMYGVPEIRKNINMVKCFIPGISSPMHKSYGDCTRAIKTTTYIQYLLLNR